MAQIIDVFSLWDVLPDQTVGVFIKAPLPGVIGVGEEPLSSQSVGDLFMVCEFSAIVVGQGKNSIMIGFQVLTDCIGTACAVLLAALMATVNRVLRSTSVTRTECACLPITVSASQSPTRLRRSTISGRFSMDTLFLI